MNEIKNKKLISDDIDEIMENEKKKYREMNPKEDLTLLKEEYATQQRIATMGRLSELGLVNWDIDRNGSSVYSKPTKN